jgi:hypothetical protein
LTLQIAIEKIKNPPKSGKMYFSRGVAHQASAPGEAPANWYVGLIQSGRTVYGKEAGEGAAISTSRYKATSSVRGTVIFSAKYADMLELGTIKMAPRPFLRPSLIEAAPRAEDFITEEIDKELATIDKERGISKPNRGRVR